LGLRLFPSSLGTTENMLGTTLIVILILALLGDVNSLQDQFASTEMAVIHNLLGTSGTAADGRESLNVVTVKKPFNSPQSWSFTNVCFAATETSDKD
jgi:hypothetical protein